jgi:F0F1-type ATP synthase delta subunit
VSAASPYATALYSAAADAGRLNEVDGELAEIADAVRGTPALARALTNTAVSGEGKRNLLAELSKGADPIVSRFL